MATTTIRLDDQLSEVGNIDLKKAQARRIEADTISSRIMVGAIATIFIGLNAAVMVFVFMAFNSDVDQMAAKKPLAPGDRLITAQVVMSLIGATVVQVGIAAVTIVSYLFPKQRDAEEAAEGKNG